MTAAADQAIPGGRLRWLRCAPLVSSLAVAIVTRTSMMPHPHEQSAIVVGLVVVGATVAQIAKGGGELLRRFFAGMAGASATTLIVLPAQARLMLMDTPLGLTVLGGSLGGHLALATARLAHAPGLLSGDFRQKSETILKELIPPAAARLAATELTVLRYAVGWRMRPDVPAGATAFSYHKAMRLLLWSLVFVAALEIVAMHALIGIWSTKAAWVTSLFSELGVVYLLGLVNSFSKAPLLVTPEGVRIRAGLIIDQLVRFDQIASIEPVLDCGDPKRAGFLKASLLSYPNIVVHLRRPMAMNRLLKGPKSCDMIGLHPDDQAAFLHAVRDGLARQRDRDGAASG